MKVHQVLPQAVTPLEVVVPKITKEEFRDMHPKNRLVYEQIAGRRRVIKIMATELVNQMREKYGITGKIVLDVSAPDDKDWFVYLEHGEVRVTDNWSQFPSEEFRTMLMLLGEMK